ncbi:MAG TPA: hypothetical protein VKU00_17045 [Chthonomonadaceae bacterium]|nr:hypothetical protein [Chthonomonadaceae bacterium]
MELLMERVVLEINASHKLIHSLSERVEKAINLSLTLRQSVGQRETQEASSAPAWGETLRSTLTGIHAFSSYAEKVCEKAQIALAVTGGHSVQEEHEDLLLAAEQALSQARADMTDPKSKSIYLATLDVWATLEMQKVACREIRTAVEGLEKALA